MKSLLLLLLLAPSLLAGPIILVANKKGSSFEAELLSVTEVTATVRRSSDKKLFSLKLSTLSEDCVKSIEGHRDKLETLYPAYESDVVIGKRRRPGSSYMVTQDITSTAKITNTDRNLDSPEITGRLVFIGQDQSEPDKFSVIATRDFKTSPAAEDTVELEFRAFSTRYDSDNEGAGNVGGFKYDGYVLILYKDDNSVAHFRTTNSRFKSAIESDIGILETFRTIKDDTDLDKNLHSARQGQKPGDDVIRVGC